MPPCGSGSFSGCGWAWECVTGAGDRLIAAEGTCLDLGMNIDLPHFQQDSASQGFSAPHLVQDMAWLPSVQAESAARARVAGPRLKMRLGDFSVGSSVKTG